MFDVWKPYQRHRFMIPFRDIIQILNWNKCSAYVCNGCWVVMRNSTAEKYGILPEKNTQISIIPLDLYYKIEEEVGNESDRPDIIRELYPGKMHESLPELLDRYGLLHSRYNSLSFKNEVSLMNAAYIVDRVYKEFIDRSSEEEIEDTKEAVEKYKKFRHYVVDESENIDYDASNRFNEENVPMIRSWKYWYENLGDNEKQIAIESAAFIHALDSDSITKILLEESIK